ncbi:MAG TPA: guanylate kinase [Phycisphaerae bacterium]|nr:guanylate kinase [Phycisphaerae bacterium]
MSEIKGKLVVVSGPSGVGKSTITRRAMRLVGAVYSVSATTRPPRPGETDGVDYRFVTRNEFEKMAAADELLEWAEVFGNFYGTPAEPVRRLIKQGKTVVLEIDVQGGLQVFKKCPDACFILVVPPSEESLRQRLIGRGTEDAISIEKRFGKAKEELQTARRSGAYTHVVVNDDLDEAVNEVARIMGE